MLYFYIYLITQIVLESFPVSSSSHLVLLERYLGRFGIVLDHYQGFFVRHQQVGMVSVDLLDHALHGVTACVIALFFLPRWYGLVSRFARCWRYMLRIILLVACADVVTLALYLMRTQLLFLCPSLGVGLVITLLLLLSLRGIPPAKTAGRLTARTALCLGLVQGFALLPGISRLASTYVIARWLAFTPRRAFEVSWLIQWPLIVVSSVYSIGTLMVCASHAALLQPPALLVMAGAGAISYGSLYWVRAWALRGRFWWFALYMVVPIIAWVWLC